MIALIDYDAGNTCSVSNALSRIGARFELTDNIEKIMSADKVIFPGVGHARAAMEALNRKGLVDVIQGLMQPVLGICVGMQLLCDHSEEGDVSCLGIIPARVVRFSTDEGLKVPHMGWNLLQNMKPQSLFDDLGQNPFAYFVHSYYVPFTEYSIASCDYGLSFSAAVKKDNFYGIQFHAEKSGMVGSAILRNFVNLS